MNKAVYTGRPEQQYPLTTDALDFIQNQILLVQQLANSFGNRVILYGCVTQTDGSITSGMVIINGEILPVAAQSAEQVAGKPNVFVQETSNNITAGGVTYTGATKSREIAFTSSAADGNTVWIWSSFKRINTTLVNVATDTAEWTVIAGLTVQTSNEFMTASASKFRYARRNGMLYIDFEIVIGTSGEYIDTVTLTLNLPNKISLTDFINYNVAQYRTDTAASRNNWHIVFNSNVGGSSFTFLINNSAVDEYGKVIKGKYVLPDF